MTIVGVGPRVRMQRVELRDGEITWTVLGPDHLPVEEIERFLEYMRQCDRSPNTVRSYVRAMTLWWQFLGLHQMIKLVKLADLRDDNGQPLRLTTTHRLRHTKATNLLNTGVPLHVVRRYLGHTSPEMAMHYAQTLDATAKAEFLRYRKITAVGDPPMSTEDLFDFMALDTRTDRVLPNGWCSLPPARSCDKGNACLTCDLFVTDRRFLPVHEDELAGLGQLIEQRQAAHEQRTGQPMPDNHVWPTLRRREEGALRSIIARLEADARVVGAGEDARIQRDSDTPDSRAASGGRS